MQIVRVEGVMGTWGQPPAVHHPLAAPSFGKGVLAIVQWPVIPRRVVRERSRGTDPLAVLWPLFFDGVHELSASTYYLRSTAGHYGLPNPAA